MPFTRVWSSTTPTGSEDAGTIDDLIREKLVDIQERMDQIVGNTSWSTGTDSIVDGTVVRALTTLASQVDTKPTINASTNVIPRRTSPTTYGDSGLSDTGTLVSLASGRAFSQLTKQYCNVRSASVQTVPQATTDILTMTTEDNDPVGMWGSNRLTPTSTPIGFGLYSLTFSCFLQTGGTTAGFTLFFRQSGTTTVGPPLVSIADGELRHFVIHASVEINTFVEVILTNSGTVGIGASQKALSAHRLY